MGSYGHHTARSIEALQKPDCEIETSRSIKDRRFDLWTNVQEKLLLSFWQQFCKMRVRLAWKWDLAAASSKNVRRIDLRNQWGWLLLSQRSLHRRWFGLSPPRQVLLLQPADSPSQNTWIHLSQISVRTQEFSQVQKNKSWTKMNP